MYEDKPLREQIFSIPNLMGYFRILLIPFFVWRYLTAETTGDYRIAALIIMVSGLTDLLDGYVARHFNMVTQVGKALDPFADKLTQGALIICLSTRYHWLIALIVLFVVKEGFMGVMGLIMLRKNKMLNGAKWYGKICTTVLYVVMFLLILLPDMSVHAANTLIVVCGAVMLLTLISYIPVFIKMGRDQEGIEINLKS
ncbi:CDP-alcohol phosphatidyltransferase family protein [Anaerolentibacter hominis]|uniref:CDP-alcohol phosphatidyltransferase family protein n=1 Tax=Anaerolentibacter hominis TaxID=3079009 RepID=UPI0031B86BAE